MLYKDFIRQIDTCPFCERKNNRVLIASEFSYLTYNIAPYHKHHLLIIPYRHVESLSDLNDQEWMDISHLQKQSILILKNLGYMNMTFLAREGNAVNKSVPHVHFHSIPEDSIGDLDMIGERMVMTPEEIDITIKEIQSVLKK